ncbi:hypothetical protein [Tunicatimonas pelagia]|uniref:hypothetical protein n=1 Tax=Tunicatimonas pelagia TaxID=931531 RepID=UPI0026669775|nr:hypothetical protein [Tunicatimonas pelagia]WKN45867.1 hypothetical protein P0M28_12945 [Tunicatimonas pelagia]
MEDNRVRIRIAWNNCEFEVEGSQQYVDTYSDTIKAFTDILKASANEPTEKDTPTKGQQISIFEQPIAAPTVKTNPDGLEVPSSFGEFYHKAPKSINKTDIVLLASYFIQSQNNENTFTTREVNKLLRDHGIDLTNTAHFNKLNQDYKKVFKMRQGQYKVSEEGVKHLIEILR